MDLIDTYRSFHQETEKHTFFSTTHRTLSRIDQMLGHKVSLEKFKESETTANIYSDHSILSLEVNYKKKTVKIINMWSLKNMLLSNQQITEEMKENQMIPRKK